MRPGVYQKEIFGCERYVLPGNHTGYRYERKVFAASVLKIFRGLEEKKKNKS